ncbi:MAG: hypothetical protein LBR20_06515 [Propionibacteriaceae bacterium]|jgi:hypothetical protein|nr:hypothetical protein [Propionibacteriaceae bacterium]
MWEAIVDACVQGIQNMVTGILMGIWKAVLFVYQLVMGFGLNLTDNLDEQIAFTEFSVWIASGVAVILAIVQIGKTAQQQNGKPLAELLWGIGKLLLFCVAFMAYAKGMIDATNILSSGLLKEIGDNGTFVSLWIETSDSNAAVTADADWTSKINLVQAFMLVLISPLVLLGSLTNLVTMIVMAGAIVVIVATSPICAAGLVNESTSSWCWKSLRWFHAAVFAKPLILFIQHLAIQFTTKQDWPGGTPTVESALDQTFVGIGLMLVAAISPMALFKLLAFVDPSTSSGAQLRAAMTGTGMFGEKASAATGGGKGASTAAQSADANGVSQGEQLAEAGTDRQLSNATSGGAGGAMGMGMGATLGAAAGLAHAFGDKVKSVSAKASAVATDALNQAGVGNEKGGTTLYPDRNPQTSVTSAASTFGHAAANTGRAVRENLSSGSSPAGGGDPVYDPPGATPPFDPMYDTEGMYDAGGTYQEPAQPGSQTAGSPVSSPDGADPQPLAAEPQQPTTVGKPAPQPPSGGGSASVPPSPSGGVVPDRRPPSGGQTPGGGRPSPGGRTVRPDGGRRN